MKKNTTPFSAEEYDKKIEKSIPFYNLFHDCVIDTAKAINITPAVWLDTGCGTGALAQKAHSAFPDTAFSLADPSAEMLAIAKSRCGFAHDLSELSTEKLNLPDSSFDAITAILCHHYCDKLMRRKATENCFRMLKSGGIYITFENIRPASDAGLDLAMRRWENYKIAQSEPPESAKAHYGRLDTEFFPITITEHLTLLKKCGFNTAELIWTSYMQAGFIAVKQPC